MSSTPAPRVLFYTHDSYGLGHLRRTLVLSRFLAARWPAAPQLVVTGSPAAASLTRPGDAPQVALPPVIKVGPGRYEPRDATRTLDDLLATRAAILLRAATDFGPDLVVVDHAPGGLLGELRGVLDRFGRGRSPTRFVLSLRDVIDAPHIVRAIWTREGVHDLLDHVYDLIVVHGWPGAHDVAEAYDLSATAAAKVRYLGYPRREPEGGALPDLPAAGEAGPLPGPLVVVTTGSGQDGAPLLVTMAEAVRTAGERVGFTTVLVEGPLMPEADRQRVRAAAAGLPAVTVVAQVGDMAGLIARAAAVVGMAGFNTVCEILSVDRPAILVPRRERTEEQRIRAAMLAARGLALMLDSLTLTPGTLLEAVLALLARPRPVRSSPPLDGLPAFADALAGLVPRAG